MAEAKQALEILSREPSAQRIAEMRREAEIARNRYAKPRSSATPIKRAFSRA